MTKNPTSEPFMTSPIGDLPVNSDGLRKAVDEIARLRSENSELRNEIAALKKNSGIDGYENLNAEKAGERTNV